METDITLILEILKRLAFATLCGACVGFERDVHGRAAGLRTHMLVAAGAALFTVISFLCSDCPLAFGASQKLNGDVTRIAANIVTGIGFMGAGTIVKSGFTVRGLTTAACLWFAAALGMACGINQIPVALIATLGSILVIFAGKIIERRLHHPFPFLLTVEADGCETVEQVKSCILRHSAYSIMTLNISAVNNPETVRAFFYIEADGVRDQQADCLQLTREISTDISGVRSVAYKSDF